MGIDATAEKVFLKGSFLVIKVSVNHVDSEKLLKPKLGPFSWLACCGENTMSHAITKKLIEVLPRKLPEKMAENGMVVEVVAKNEADQQEYLDGVKESIGAEP